MKHIIYIIGAAVMLAACGGGQTKPVVADDYVQQSPEFCEDSAYSYVAAQCAYGPRTMNSEAHDLCGQWIADKFAGYGATVTDQYADEKLGDGTKVRLRNIVASFNPDATERIMISSHWDSRPWADNEDDESLHQQPIDGANDGASGVGVLLEIARVLSADMAQCGDSSFLSLNSNIGIDLICWDAEDAGLHDNNESWCIGSQYWSGKHHVDGYTARYGILLDMVGGNNTVFNKEGYSVRCAPQLVDMVWRTGHKLGYGKWFRYTPNDEIGFVTDDHVPVNRCGIPCIDILGNDAEDGSFPATWHTLSDNISNISKQTLKAVGQTVLEVIYTEK